MTPAATPNCEACPLAAQESRRVLSHGPLDAAVVVVGKAPDEADLKAGKPFVGGVGSELMRCLQRAGWDTDTLLFANAVCCQPPDKFSFTKKALEPCFPVLDELIRSHPRKLIIALGNEAFASIMHVNPTGVEKGAGLVKQSAYDCPVLWTHHPFKVSMSPQVMPQFVDHLKKALHISVHGADHDPAENARKMMVREPAGLRKLVDYCKQRGHAGEMMAFDIETTGTDRFDNEILGIAFGFCDFGAYVPLRHGTNGSAAALDPNSPELLAHNAELAEIEQSIAALKQQKLKPAEERKLSAPLNKRKDEMVQAIFPVSNYAEMVELLRELLEDPDIEKCAHFGKFDTTFIINKLGIHTRGYVADPMLLHTLLDENLPHGLKYLSRQELGAPDYDADTKDYFKPGKHLGMAPLPTVAKYAALDCIYTARLVRKFLVDAQQMGVLDIHDRLLMPLTYELGQLELTGMQPDPVALEAVGDRVEKRMAQLFTAINDMTGLGETKLPSRGEKDKQIGINPGSDADLRYVLFEYYGLSPIKTTESGAPSVDKEVRTQLMEMLEASGENPMALRFLRAIHEYSTLSTFNGTFVKGTREYVRDDGRVHCSHGYSEKTELAPNTGRLSCNSPNIQNVMKSFQPVYITSPDRCFVQSDFKAIEVRVWACLSRDKDLMKYISTPGMDFHREIGAIALNKRPEDVTDAERQISKVCVFGGLMYQGNTPIVMKQTGCTEAEATTFLDRINRRFPVGKAWLDGMMRYANEHHEVRSLIGRVRHLPDIVSVSRGVRESASRQACNSPIQSLASDKNNMALIEMQDWLRWYGTDAPWLPTDEETSWDWLERRLTYRKEIEDALHEVQEKGPALKSYTVATIHDCLIWEAARDEVELLTELCHTKMTRRLCAEWPEELPLAVDVSVSGRWHDDVLDIGKICDLEADDL